MRKLTNIEFEQLQKSFDDAFDRDSLEQMLRLRLGKKLSSLVPTEKDFLMIIFKLIDRTEREGWTIELIMAARQWNPGNAVLLEFCQQLGLAPDTPSESNLERVIREEDGFLDMMAWRIRMAEIERQVCRVEVYSIDRRRVFYGTGFLLGPDIVMTNHHVVQTVVRGTDRPEDVILRFDYKRLKDGTALNPGTRYRLLENDWLVDWSTMSPVDSMRQPKVGIPEPDQLDYALMRIEGSPGNEPIGGKKRPNTPLRGWMKPSFSPYSFPPDTALFIVQHPQGEPLSFAINTHALIGQNANQTRITYRTNTKKGSSGSPCFNINWDLVALHHTGDPNFDEDHKPEYNEGIPFSAILALLERRHLKEKLDKYWE